MPPPAPPLPERPSRQRRALRAIALFEGIKGIAAIAASLGVLELVHHDARRLAMALIGHYGLNPLHHYPALLLHYADALQDANLRNVLLLAWGYAAIRLLEAYGLWRDRAWAEWLAALSGALYVPFEVRHVLAHPTAINGGVLLANLAVVGFMAWRLGQRGSTKGAAPAPPAR